jgi:hypothetical protein
MINSQKFQGSPVLLLISGILIYKSLVLLEAIVSYVSILLISNDLLLTLKVSFYLEQLINLIIISVLLRWVFLAAKRREIPFFNNQRFFFLLGISFVTLSLGAIVLRWLSENQIPGVLEQYEAALSRYVANDYLFHQFSLIMANVLKVIILMVLFFLLTRRQKLKTRLEWPLTHHNEYVVPSSMDNENSGELQEESDDEYILPSIEDLIYYDNNQCRLVWGSLEEGYTVTELMNISELTEANDQKYTLSLNSPVYASTSDLIAKAGTTSYGGAGYVALKEAKSQKLRWLMHLSDMNNPIEISFENDIILVKTDNNYPHGVLYNFPVANPEKFTTKLLG